MTKFIAFIFMVVAFSLSLLSMSKEPKSYKDSDHSLTDPPGFNRHITEKGVNSVEEIFKLYYHYDPEEEGGKPVINSYLLDDGKVKGVLIHDRLPDDSIRAIRIIMTFKPVNPGWDITEILESYRCWEGRGHTNWSTDKCR